MTSIDVAKHSWLKRGVGAWAVVLAAVAVCPLCASADTFLLPPNGDNVVGAVSLASTENEDTLSDLAYAYDQGYIEMRIANPAVDPWLPGRSTEVLIPSQYILPDAPREGIVINLPEMRLYYYPKVKRGEPRVVLTYPISIGPQDWRTPIGLTKLVAKRTDPPWYPPASIRDEHFQDGEVLPKVIPPGPDNPLGKYALSLGHPGYLIHGTNKPYGVGMRVTHGCIRLYPKDIERLFKEVAVGTSVRIVNQPFKIGRLMGILYVEAHPHLEEDSAEARDDFTQLNGLVMNAVQDMAQEIDWNVIQRTVSDKKGIPTAITAGPVAAEPGLNAGDDMAPELPGLVLGGPGALL